MKQFQRVKNSKDSVHNLRIVSDEHAKETEEVRSEGAAEKDVEDVEQGVQIVYAQLRRLTFPWGPTPCRVEWMNETG